MLWLLQLHSASRPHSTNQPFSEHYRQVDLYMLALRVVTARVVTARVVTARVVTARVVIARVVIARVITARVHVLLNKSFTSPIK